VRGNKSSEASEKIQTRVSTWPTDEELERKRNHARRKSRQASTGNLTEMEPVQEKLEQENKLNRASDLNGIITSA
jgi:hypothetical protein